MHLISKATKRNCSKSSKLLEFAVLDLKENRPKIGIKICSLDDEEKIFFWLIAVNIKTASFDCRPATHKKLLIKCIICHKSKFRRHNFGRIFIVQGIDPHLADPYQ